MEYYTKVIKNYAVFTGRARRKEYWMFGLVNAIISFVLGILSEITLDGSNTLGGFYTLFLLIPSLAVGARRLHDIGRSAWWLLLYLIPIVGWIVLIVFFIRDSQPGTNQYGPNPKEETVVETAPVIEATVAPTRPPVEPPTV
jgi:uncharacterized membrane protein YhaH (DUF805 family)